MSHTILLNNKYDEPAEPSAAIVTMPIDRGTVLYGGCRFALLSLLIDAPVSEAETDLLLRQCAARPSVHARQRATLQRCATL